MKNFYCNKAREKHLKGFKKKKNSVYALSQFSLFKDPNYYYLSMYKMN